MTCRYAAFSTEEGYFPCFAVQHCFQSYFLKMCSVRITCSCLKYTRSYRVLRFTEIISIHQTCWQNTVLRFLGVTVYQQFNCDSAPAEIPCQQTSLSREHAGKQADYPPKLSAHEETSWTGLSHDQLNSSGCPTIGSNCRIHRI